MTARHQTRTVFFVAALAWLPACQMDRATPGQPTMNEWMHRRVGQQRDWQQREAERVAATKMTPAERAAAEALLVENPADEKTRLRLLWYYRAQGDAAARRRHVLWFIAHAPENSLAELAIDPRVDGAGFEQGRRLWQEQLALHATPRRYRLAAHFVQAGDRPGAERLLRQGQQAYPDDPDWTRSLGEVYASMLTDGTGARTAELRGELAGSRNAELLFWTGEALLRGARTRDPAGAEGERLVERAVALRPDMRAWREMLAQWRKGVRGMELMRRHQDIAAALAQASGADREWLLRQAAANAFWQGQLDEVERYARQLDSGSYDAGIFLGKVALRRGDKKSAARYLRQAAAAPDLPFEPMMELPRALVDWGERSAAAEFLETLRARQPENPRAARWRVWAQELRQGINPDLIPYTGGCAQDPC